MRRPQIIGLEYLLFGQVHFGGGLVQQVGGIARFISFGALVNYTVGTVWCMFAAGLDLAGALAACVIPFIPTAILKIILAGILGPMLRNTLMKANVLQPEGYSQRKEAQNA